MVFYVFGMQKLILFLIMQLYLHPNTKAFDVPVKGVGIFFVTKFYFAESQSKCLTHRLYLFCLKFNQFDLFTEVYHNYILYACDCKLILS